MIDKKFFFAMMISNLASNKLHLDSFILIATLGLSLSRGYMLVINGKHLNKRTNLSFFPNFLTATIYRDE